MLTTDPNKVCFIIVKAREYDAKVEAPIPEEGSNPTDDNAREVLEDLEDDPTLEELTRFIEALNEDEQAEVVALAWIGRGDFDKEEWEDAVEEARRNAKENTVNYLTGTPLLSDHLEEGLSLLGYSCEDFEMNNM